MNRDILCIRAWEKVRDLLNIFVKKQVSGVPVVDD
jgi:predicted transcriptional regulator